MKHKYESKYAHSIKNPHIIHKLVRGHYLCISCCPITPLKSTQEWDKVTCKNCLRKVIK